MPEYTPKDRADAIQVLIAVMMLAANRSPANRAMIIDKAMLAMLVLGASEQELLTGTITSDFIKIPVELMSQLVDL